MNQNGMNQNGMNLNRGGQNCVARRKSAIRAGLLAVSAAAAGLAGSITARADITVTNPFSSFAPVNENAAALSTPSGIGYNSSGTSFETTNGQGNEAVSGFYSAPQTVSSFDVSFILTATSGADGGAFIINGNSTGTTYLGGGGSSGGYDGGTNEANTIALQWEFYNNPSAGVSRNGTSGTIAWSSVADQDNSSTYLPPIDNGDQVQFNLAYYGTTLTENVVDLTSHRGIAQVFSNIKMPTIAGTNTAYVGFSGGTSGAASTQKISNFTMVSNKTYAPISLASSSFNATGIVSSSTPLSSLSVTQDNGTQKGGDTWYAQGFNATYPTTGIPVGGSTFTSQADNSHSFYMQPYTGNDVIELAAAGQNKGPSTATITFASNSQPYNALSFLTASGNGPQVIGVVVNYTNGTSTSGLSFLSPDWFSGSPSAWTANGRYSGTYDNVNSGNPNLYAEDILLPDNVDPVSSLTLTFQGGNRPSGYGAAFIFAVSGEAGAAGPSVTWTGAVSSKWDQSTYNWNGTSGSIVEAVTFASGDVANFDDTSPVSTHVVNLSVANMNASAWNVNTSTGYVFTGVGMNGSGGLVVNAGGGTGPVVLTNSNTYTGSTSVVGGLLQLNSSSAVASTLISVASGATMNVSAGAALTGSNITLNNSGTFNDYNSTLTLGSLAGASTGVLNLNGTALTVASTSYAGVIGGTSGSVAFTGGGTFAGTIQDGTTSPISVTVNASGGVLAFNGNNTYSGGTYLVAGVLQAGVGNAIANGTGSIYFQGGSLGASSLSTVSSPVTVANPLVYTQSTGLAFDASNPVVITNNGATIPLFNGSTPLVVTHGTYAGTNNGSTVTINSVITDPAVGSGALNITGEGLLLAASNTYSGGTTLNGATDVLASNTASFGTGPINFNNGGIGVTNSSSGLVLTTPWTFGASPSAYFENNAPFTMAGAAFLGTGATYSAGAFTGGNASGGTVYVYAPSLLVSGSISGGGLTLGTGSTLLELSGAANTFTGPVIVNGGILQLDSAGSIAGLNPAVNASTGTIIVNSGGSLLINDTTGYLGLAGGVVGGAPITLQLTGTGNGGTGALTTPGGTGSNYTWAGTINASGAALIAPGYGSGSPSSPTTLTLTGAITGTGPVLFGANDSNANAGYSQIVLATASSNYSGESQVYGDATALGQLIIQLGANNAFSSAPTSGLNFNSGGMGATTVDLYGYNQSVGYLTNAGTSNLALTNSQTPLSTLTVSNGNLPGGAGASFGVPITGNIAVLKTGAGNQTLTAVNTFTGGLTVAAGTLTVPTSAALGNSTVKLSGGTLALSAPSSISGFGSIATGGAATLSSGVVTLNPYAASNGSALTTAPLTISDASGFTTSFVYYPSPEGSNYTAGGMAFNLINTNSVAGGTFGNGSAWRGIAIDFSLDYTGAGTYTGLEVNGSQSVTNSYGISPWNVADTGLAGGPITVTLTYANDTLTELLVCPNPGDAAGVTPTPGISTTFTYSNVDIASDLGASAGGAASAYVGFTGANLDGNNSTTSYNARQQISAFTFSGGGTVPVAVNSNNPIIATTGTSSTLSVSTATGANTETLNGGLTIQSGATLKLTQVAGSSGVLVLQIPSSTSLSLAGTAGAWTGKLDIGTSDLDIATPSTLTPVQNLATLTSMVAQGYAGGTWNPSTGGIYSSTAAASASHLTAVGVILNDSNQSGGGVALYGAGGGIASTFDGAAVGLDDVLVKYTYYGDVNLDGAIDGSDYSVVDASYLAENFSGGVATTPISGWGNGDFNYDGVVDGSDYTLMDNAFNQQGLSLGVNPAAQLATSTALVAGGSAVVPEPTTLGLLAIGGAALLGRRRRWTGSVR